MPFRPVWYCESDSSGKPIRADVLEAAKEKWPLILALGRRRLGDQEQEIQELFEKVVASTSAHLEAIQAPPQDPSGLLVFQFRRQLSGLAQRIGRVVASGSGRDIESLLPTVDLSDETDRRLLLEELVRTLSKRNRAVLRLRRAGYEWDEIATMMGSTVDALRNGFWREIRKAYSQLAGPLNNKRDEE